MWVLSAAGCSDDEGLIEGAGARQGDGGWDGCAEDRECWDGIFCNGDELCLPQGDGADAQGCVAAPSGPCFASQQCDEDSLRCITDCDANPDADGDGHLANVCGGDDCVDNDATTFPGNPEVCDPDHHDEDCDLRTFGVRDEDGDGFADQSCCNQDGDELRCGEDCNDARRSVNPNSVEVCDGLDNDCDQEVDEGVALTYYEDADGDGYGDAESPMQSCEAPSGYALSGTDCDDGSADVSPAAYDRCDTDERDDDCDGEANNPAGGCSCEMGASRSCLRPGACASGVQNCIDGIWGECSIAPVSEQCNGVDDNCDGVVDEGCRCGAGMQLPCGLGVGQCTKGFQVCQTDGLWGSCVGAGEPSVELCDQVDNDCDGMVDEDPITTFFVDADGDGFGDATRPIPSCGFEDGVSNLPLDCDDTDGAIHPGGAELCDNVDSDCNGRLDGPGEDDDGDGIASQACGGLDCNDSDPTSTSCSSPIIMGDVTIGSLLELALLAGVSEITGNLVINNSVNFMAETLTQLSSLSSLVRVGGTLTIQSNAFLTSLTGLSSLKSVGGLLIRSNSLLPNLDGLEALTDTGAQLQVQYNYQLTSVAGLSGLVDVPGDLIIDSNDVLTQLSGLENLRTVAGTLEVTGCSDNCDVVTDLSALDGVTRVDGDVVLTGFSELLDLNGLKGLQSVGGSLRIGQNRLITTVSGLTSLKSVGGNVRLDWNDQLLDLPGLASLESVDGQLSVENCPVIQDVAALDPGLSGSLTRIGVSNDGAFLFCGTPLTVAQDSANALVSSLQGSGYVGTATVVTSCPP